MADKGKKFKHYYRQYKDKVYTYLYYRVNFNQALAEDLCSEVFVKALQNLESFDRNKSFQAWIYAIARNHLINHYRVAGREVGLMAVDGILDEPWETVNIGLECELVVKAMSELKPYYRDVLLLRWVDGLNNQEIAQVLEKDEGAVRTQLSRAIEALRGLCKKYE